MENVSLIEKNIIMQILVFFFFAWYNIFLNAICYNTIHIKKNRKRFN